MNKKQNADRLEKKKKTIKKLKAIKVSEGGPPHLVITVKDLIKLQKQYRTYLRFGSTFARMLIKDDPNPKRM